MCSHWDITSWWVIVPIPYTTLESTLLYKGHSFRYTTLTYTDKEHCIQTFMVSEGPLFGCYTVDRLITGFMDSMGTDLVINEQHKPCRSFEKPPLVLINTSATLASATLASGKHYIQGFYSPQNYYISIEWIEASLLIYTVHIAWQKEAQHTPD